MDKSKKKLIIYFLATDFVVTAYLIWLLTGFKIN
jgi:hypothetical protein